MKCRSLGKNSGGICGHRLAQKAPDQKRPLIWDVAGQSDHHTRLDGVLVPASEAPFRQIGYLAFFFCFGEDASAASWRSASSQS